MNLKAGRCRLIVDGTALGDFSCAVELVDDSEQQSFGFLSGPIDQLKAGAATQRDSGQRTMGVVECRAGLGLSRWDLIRNELPHRGVAQHALGLEMPHLYPQLRAQPLSRALPQSPQWRLGDRQCCHSFPPSRSERPRRVQDSRAGKTPAGHPDLMPAAPRARRPSLARCRAG
jgi:hypothetical protein